MKRRLVFLRWQRSPASLPQNRPGYYLDHPPKDEVEAVVVETEDAKPAFPPPPVRVRTVVFVPGRGARREPWRWWMLFTARGGDMTVGEWLDDKKLAVMDWPLTWKLGMILPGLLGGWLFWLRMGPEWNLRHCMFVGGLVGLLFPMLFLHFLETVFAVVVFGLLIGALYWAFPGFIGGYLEFMGAILRAIWKTALVIWEKARG